MNYDIDITEKIRSAPRGNKSLEIRTQALIYFSLTENSTGKEFVEIAQISASYFAEADKMKAMLPRLKDTGFNFKKL
jgi:hypothetical protein